MDRITFTPVEGNGNNLVARARVPVCPGLIISGWAVFRDDDRISVVPPRSSYLDANGQRRYARVLHFDTREIYDAWMDRIRGEYLRWEAEGRHPGAELTEDEAA